MDCAWIAAEIDLILNQIARRLTETLPADGAASAPTAPADARRVPRAWPARLLRDRRWPSSLATACARSWWRNPCTRSTGPTGTITPSSTTATCASPSLPTTSAPPSASPMPSVRPPSCGRRRTSRGAACRPGCRTCRCRSRRRHGPCSPRARSCSFRPVDALVLASGIAADPRQEAQVFRRSQFPRPPARPTGAGGGRVQGYAAGRAQQTGPVARAGYTSNSTRPGRRCCDSDADPPRTRELTRAKTAARPAPRSALVRRAGVGARDRPRER